MTANGQYWKRLGRDMKVIGFELKHLDVLEAALLFITNIHRPLFVHDFEESVCTDVAPVIIRHREHALWRLAESPVLRALGGNPGRIIAAADAVDHSLGSLLSHPCLARTPGEGTC